MAYQVEAKVAGGRFLFGLDFQVIFALGHNQPRYKHATPVFSRIRDHKEIPRRDLGP